MLSGTFTLLGFSGIYLLLGILFIILVLKELNHDPEEIKSKDMIDET